MEAIIRPGSLKGSLIVPASKSHMQRVLAGALLHNGRTIINNPGHAADEQAALKVILDLGAVLLEQSDERMVILSEGKINPAGIIDCGESGLAARLFTPIAAISGQPVMVSGYGTLLKRSMSAFEEFLPLLNISLPGFSGLLPFQVRGPLKPASLKIDGSLSSQYLTGLLFALSFTADEIITIEVENLKSRPYIDLTLEVLEQFGRKIIHQEYRSFTIDPALSEEKQEVVIDIEGDWSSAAFWLVAAAICGDLSLKGLNPHSMQADKAILTALEMAGANIHIRKDEITISRDASLKAFLFDAADAPDLFPALSVLALFCEGETHIRGLHRLKHKESDRARSICDMLEAFGAAYTQDKDELRITGPSNIKGTVINGHDDHRIVMAAAIAALTADGETTIQKAEAVSKSYPAFFDHLAMLRSSTN